MGKLRWYINRLKAMDIREIIYRILTKWPSSSDSKKNEMYLSEFDSHNFIFNALTTINFSETAIIFNKKVSIKSTDWFNSINRQLEWNNGLQSKDFRHNKGFDEVRYVWEFNRLQHLTHLFYVSAVSNDLNELKAIELILANWISQNESGKGINWTSAMEVAIRSISLQLCSSFYNMFAGENLNSDFKSDLEKTAIDHIGFVSRNLASYSSANNHLIIEALALLIGGIQFKIDIWSDLGKKILEREVILQNHSDGVNKEQAFHYQSFVMEAYLLAILFMRKNKIAYNQELEIYLVKMSEFVASVRDYDKNMPQVGDSDDGHLINIANIHEDHYEYVLQFSSLMLNQRYTSLEDLSPNLKILFSEEDIISTNKKDCFDTDVSRVYESGGYTVLKSRGLHKLDLLFDHGELGFGSIAAHAHADALSFTLSVDGKQIFVDPGTYIYNIEEEWRNYFRKTVNHNCLSVQGKDQSEMLGSFLWGKRANCKLIDKSIGGDIEYVIAEHDGYKPVIHQRKIEVTKSENKIVVSDTLTKEIDWICNLVLHPKCSVVCDFINHLVKIETEGACCRIQFSGIDKLEIMDSWYSGSFGSKEPTKAIRAYGLAKIISCEIEAGV